MGERERERERGGGVVERGCSLHGLVNLMVMLILYLVANIVAIVGRAPVSIIERLDH